MVTKWGAGGVGWHRTMVALGLQQFQHKLKKIFRRRLVIPMLFGACESPPPPKAGGKGGRVARGRG